MNVNDFVIKRKTTLDNEMTGIEVHIAVWYKSPKFTCTIAKCAVLLHSTNRYTPPHTTQVSMAQALSAHPLWLMKLWLTVLWLVEL